MEASPSPAMLCRSENKNCTGGLQRWALWHSPATQNQHTVCASSRHARIPYPSFQASEPIGLISSLESYRDIPIPHAPGTTARRHHSTLEITWNLASLDGRFFGVWGIQLRFIA